nr:DUF1376 domain-containing protein [Aurantimonas marina]
MTVLPFISQSCGDVLAETAHLSAEEFGAYQLLTFAFWQHGALPDDDQRLARIARVTPERWAELKDTLAELFGIDWAPERLAKRRNEVEAAHLTNVRKGKKGAQKRWQKAADSPTIGPVNSWANGNHNHNHRAPAHEEEALPYTHARTRDDLIPRPRSEADGLAILQRHEAFPGDYDMLLSKLMRGELHQSEIG